MLNVKTKFFEAEPSNNFIVQKMTYYARIGIDTLQKAISKEVPASKKVHAYFVLAQLYRNFFSPSIDEQMEHTKNAIEAYATVIEIQEELNDDDGELIKRSKEAKDMLERQVKTHEKSIANQSSASLVL